MKDKLLVAGMLIVVILMFGFMLWSMDYGTLLSSAWEVLVK